MTLDLDGHVGRNHAGIEIHASCTPALDIVLDEGVDAADVADKLAVALNDAAAKALDAATVSWSWRWEPMEASVAFTERIISKEERKVKSEADLEAMAGSFQRSIDKRTADVWEGRTVAGMAPMIDYGKLLRDTMSAISEDGYCAGWMMGLEYSLWAILVGDHSPDYGQVPVTPEEVAMLKGLSEAAGGWLVWDDASETDDAVLIPMAEWEQKYLDWLKKRGAAS